MEKYKALEMEVIKTDTEDVITTSGGRRDIEMPEETNIEGVDDSVSNEPMTLAAVHNLVDGKKFVFVRVFNINGTTLSTVIIKDESNNYIQYEYDELNRLVKTIYPNNL